RREASDCLETAASNRAGRRNHRGNGNGSQSAAGHTQYIRLPGNTRFATRRSIHVSRLRLIRQSGGGETRPTPPQSATRIQTIDRCPYLGRFRSAMIVTLVSPLVTLPALSRASTWMV